MTLYDILEIPPSQAEQVGVAQGGRGCGTRPGREKRHFAERVGRAKPRDPSDGARAGIRRRDADTAGHDGVESVAFLALLEQRPPARNDQGDHPTTDRGRGVRVQPRRNGISGALMLRGRLRIP